MSGLPVTRSWCLLPLWWLLTTCCLSPAAFMLDPGVGKGAPAQFWGTDRREGGLPQSRIGSNNAGEVRQEGSSFSKGMCMMDDLKVRLCMAFVVQALSGRNRDKFWGSAMSASADGSGASEAGPGGKETSRVRGCLRIHVQITS